MTTLNAFVYNQQKFGYVPHTSVSGETWQFIKNGTATSNGASDGTTVIDTNSDSGAANTYNGKYWIRCLSGTNTGQWHRIVDDDGSGTYTMEGDGFEAQVASGVSFEIWKSPEPVFNVTASSGATDIRDSGRTEADDFWIGYWAVVVSGSKRGEKAQITDSTSSGGILVVGTGLSGALTVGDVVLLRKFVEVEGLAPSLEEQYNPRVASRVDFEIGDGVVGKRGGTVTFKAAITASNSPSAADAAATKPLLGGLLQGCGFDEILGSSATVSTGSTTTSIGITDGKAANFVRPGVMVVWNGHPAFITDMDTGASPDTITVTPTLPNTPASSDVCYATTSYFKNVTGNSYGICLEWEVDGIRTTMTGCKGSVTLETAEVLKMNFNFNVDHWIREREAAPYQAGATYTTAPMIQSHDQRCWLSDTATSIGMFTASIDAEVAERPVQGSAGINGRSGYQLVRTGGSCTFREIMNSDTAGLPQQNRFNARTAKDVIVAWGSHGNMFAVRVCNGLPVESFHPADSNGMVDVPNVIKAQDGGIIAYGSSNGTVARMPSIVFSFS